MQPATPIRVYLDTSDYSHLYSASPDSALGHIRTELFEHVAARRIAIGLSAPIFSEFIQPATSEYLIDRYERAAFLRDLCAGNAFPWIYDFPKGTSFPNRGIWLPLNESREKDFSVELLIAHIFARGRDDGILPRGVWRSGYDRQRLVRYLLREGSGGLAKMQAQGWIWPYGRKFVSAGGLNQFLRGEITEDEANLQLTREFYDPVNILDRIVNGKAGEMKFTEKFHLMALQVEKVVSALDHELNSMLADGLKVGGDLARQLVILHAPQIVELWGFNAALLLSQVIYAFRCDRQRKIKRSDSGDLMHAMYLPLTDLWRGDRSFSNLLIRGRVDCHDRIVPRLEELPIRISESLRNRGAENGGI